MTPILNRLVPPPQGGTEHATTDGGDDTGAPDGATGDHRPARDGRTCGVTKDQ